MKDIILENINKAYDAGEVLSGFSHTFTGGSITSVMGPSGCGKTTLISIIMGVVQQDSGSVSGVPARIGAVFQEDRLAESYTVLSNITMGIDAHEAKSDTYIERIKKCIEDIGLAGMETKKVSELSGGQKRRVAIARAVIIEPELLILDEAFKGLDDKTRDDIVRYVLEHKGDATIISVTHSDEEADLLGGEVLRLR